MSIFEIEIASIFSVLAIWFCNYTLAFALYTVWLVVFRISMSIFEIEIASIFFVCNLVCTYLPSFFVPYGWLYSESSYGRTTVLSSTD